MIRASLMNALSRHHSADLHRASDPPFYGFRLLEGPQGHRRRTADHLSRKGRRSRRSGAQHVRCRPVGAQIPGDCPELAAQLGPGHPVLCVPRRGPADHLHHQRNRSPEREAASRRKNARPFSNGRSSDQTALPRLARCRRGMENAAKGVVRSQNSIRHYVRRKVRHGMMVNPAPHTKFLTVPLAKGIRADYGTLLPSAVACFEDDFEACIAHLRLPVTHRRSTRTTNLLERLFGEERRRLKIIPNGFGEKPVLKLMFGALVRAAERWRGLRFTEFELRQIAAVRKDLDAEYEATRSDRASQTRVSSRSAP